MPWVCQTSNGWENNVAGGVGVSHKSCQKREKYRRGEAKMTEPNGTEGRGFK